MKITVKDISSFTIKRNKTMYYMLPAILKIGNNDEMRDYLDNINRIAFGLGDDAVDLEGDYIFMLVDSNYNPAKIEQLIDYLHNQRLLVKTYPYGDVNKVNLLMIVFKLTPEGTEQLKLFKQGKYSQMYLNDPELRASYYFPGSQGHDVIFKTPEGRIKLLEEVRKLFGRKPKNELFSQKDIEHFEENSIRPFKETDWFTH